LKSIKKTLIHWKLPVKKLYGIVTDNAANFGTALQGFNHFHCLAHTLQLIVKEGTKAFNEVINRCKKLIEHFKKSSKSTQLLMSKQSFGKRQLKLKQDVPTRWNSTFLMLQRLLMLQIPVTSFMEATELLSNSQNVSLSLFIPILVYLHEKLSTSTSSNSMIESSKKHLLQQIASRWGQVRMEYFAATFLDVRFKMLKGVPNEIKSHVYAFILHKMQQQQPQDDVPYQIHSTTPENELGRYMSLPPEPDVNPLNWWRNHRFEFQKLASLSQVLLCVPATETPCERAFSKAGDVFTKKRSSLDPNKAAKQLFLFHNLKYFEADPKLSFQK